MIALARPAAAAPVLKIPVDYAAPSLSDLGQMSIEELTTLPVTSVAKRAQPVGQAPAAIYVITHDDIERSGATSIPEMLRLAPNLQVAQSSASHYVITARGFSGANAAQNFSNKLLVLIDGRTVYTPLYSGVYWDMQDVLPADIERIEVISGPGATLWGANAVNGVINIITRRTADTQGGQVEIGGGNLEQSASLQYGGGLSSTATWRAYAKTTFARDTVTAANTNGGDHWTKPQAGFRLDWSPSKVDSLTVQGDIYDGAETQAGANDELISGRNVLGRWSHAFTGAGDLQVQAYWDRTGRETQAAGGGRFQLDTYDIDLQHSFSLGGRNDVVWGGGVRSSRYRIDGTPTLLFIPASRTLNLANGFVQDTFAVTPSTHLVMGVKLEDDPYTGLAVLPNVRLSQTLGDGAMVWGAISRAVRSPTPFDRDVVEKVGSVVFLTGRANFKPESLTAYELGARAQPASRLSVSISGFFNDYDDLKTIETTPVSFLPLLWGNGMHGDTWGVEAWGDYQAAPWWRLSAGFNLLYERLSFRPGASGILGVSQAGDDPPHQAFLRSSVNLGRRVTWEADLRYVGALPNPAVPAYGELNTSLGWAINDRVKLTVSGLNLLHDRHQELPAPANAVPRSFFASLRWGF